MANPLLPFYPPKNDVFVPQDRGLKLRSSYQTASERRVGKHKVHLLVVNSDYLKPTHQIRSSNF